MIKAGFSPSVRLFEAAACGTAIITDSWAGLETIFEPGKEVLVAESTSEMLALLQTTSEASMTELGEAARKRFLSEHTAEHRATELEGYVWELSRRQVVGHEENRSTVQMGRGWKPPTG